MFRQHDILLIVVDIENMRAPDVLLFPVYIMVPVVHFYFQKPAKETAKRTQETWNVKTEYSQEYNKSQLYLPFLGQTSDLLT